MKNLYSYVSNCYSVRLCSLSFGGYVVHGIVPRYPTALYSGYVEVFEEHLSLRSALVAYCIRRKQLIDFNHSHSYIE